MSGGQQSENTMHEAAIGWAILGVVFAVLIYVFWSYFDTEIRNLIRWLRYGQMYLVSFFVSDDYMVYFDGEYTSFMAGFELTPEYTAEELTYQHLAYFNALAMQPLKWPFAIIIGAGALWAVFKGPRTYHRSKLGLDGLIQRQAKNFPVIAPFVEFNPATQPPRPPGSPVPAELPEFAEALGPEEWLAYNSIANVDGKLDEDAIAKKFTEQLGGRWKGPKKIPAHMQVLLAAFCLKAVRKRSESDDMLGRLSMCWSKKKGLRIDRKLLLEARKVLRNKDIAGKSFPKINQHAFVTTAMLRALQTAREEGGVLAPAQFVWLRAYDRNLWYPLNNLGRQSFHMEALGAMSHYKMEKRTGRPIPVPKIEDAVKTIRDYMKSRQARPIPQLDYSKSSKKGIKQAV